MASDPRAICADCGHARSWHDRDAARKAAQADTGPERPCYREIGGAPCRCSGFRDSGEVAVSASLVPSPASFSKNLILTLLLVVTGVALLYAYLVRFLAISLRTAVGWCGEPSTSNSGGRS